MKTHLSGKTLESMLRRLCAESGQALQPVCLHALAGGGRTRANLLVQASECENRLTLQAACAVEMMHAATLLQDDIFDRSAERRGLKAAYLEFGEAQAVLASDWLLLRSLELAAEVHPVFFQQLACAARTMAATVAKELNPPVLTGHSAACSYIEEICQGKTAALFAVSLHGAALLNRASNRSQAQAWAAVGNRIGCTYQLLDDCLDVYAPEGALNKSTKVDLRQGRMTLPLLTALQELRNSGQEISMERFRRSSLTPTEMSLLEHAIGDEAVRESLEDEVEKQKEIIEESARTSALPQAAIMTVLSDMQAKVALCFGRSQGSNVLTAEQQQAALAI